MLWLRLPDGDTERRATGKIREPYVLHVSQAHICIADPAGQVSAALRNMPAGDGGGGADNEETGMMLEEESKVLHEELTEFLGKEKIDRRCVLADGEEGFVGGLNVCEITYAGTELPQDGHGMSELAFWEIGERYVDQRVAGGLIMRNSSVAVVEDR